MTNQEIFNKVAAHLLTQNKVCTTTFSCSYKNENGLKCAAGCLIPDELYNPKIEGCTWICLGSRAGDLFSKWYAEFSKENHILINRLQKIHDNLYPADWKHHLGLIAEIFKLNPQILESFQEK